jgi:hypothetical protein
MCKDAQRRQLKRFAKDLDAGQSLKFPAKFQKKANPSSCFVLST